MLCYVMLCQVMLYLCYVTCFMLSYVIILICCVNGMLCYFMFFFPSDYSYWIMKHVANDYAVVFAICFFAEWLLRLVFMHNDTRLWMEINSTLTKFLTLTVFLYRQATHLCFLFPQHFLSLIPSYFPSRFLQLPIRSSLFWSVERSSVHWPGYFGGQWLPLYGTAAASDGGAADWRRMWLLYTDGAKS